MTDLILPDDPRLDSVLSALNNSVLQNRQSGMGMAGLDPFTQVQVSHATLLSELQLRALFRGSWFIRRLIEAPARDMVKAGVKLDITDGGDEDTASQALQIYRDGGQNVNPYSRRMGCGQSFQKAETYARWFGRAYTVMRVNGGEDPAKPLQSVRSFEGLSVLDRYQLRPALGTLNPEEPEFYQVQRADNAIAFKTTNADYWLGQRIHESRVLVFDGPMIHPYDVAIEGDGGHDSVIQQVYEVFCRHFSAKDAISKGLDSYSLFKVTINGLGQLLQAPNGTDSLKTYLNTIAQQMSLHRILVQDGEASNSEFQERSFAGVDKNFAHFVDELTAAAWPLPHYKIWGSVDKAALADSGGAESRAYAEDIASLQREKFADNHRRLFTAIFEAIGTVPESWEVIYPSIYQATPEEEESIRKMEADRYEVLARAGIVDPLEAKLAIATQQPLENVFDSDEIRQQLEAAKSQPAQSEGGGTLSQLKALFGAREESEESSQDDSRRDSWREDKTCLKGRPCGRSCIARSKVCRKKVAAAPKQAAKAAAKKTKSANPSKELASALARGDYDAAAKAANDIYLEAKHNLAPDDSTFYEGIKSGNARPDDWILKKLYSDLGYDKKPKQVTARTIDNDFKNGQYVAYRAMGSSQARFDDLHNDQHFANFKDGDYYAGHGIYGHGTYVAYAVQGGTHSRQTAVNSSSPYGSGVMRMSLARDANVVKQSDHNLEVRRLDRELKNWYQQTGDKTAYRRLRAVTIGDSLGQNGTSGRLAVLQGVDAIMLDQSYDPTYMNLLNRGKVRVQKTPGQLYTQ